MRFTRGLLAAAALAGGSTPLGAQANIPPSIEFRVPKPPTVAVGDSGAFLSYELHVLNLTTNPMLLQRVEVLGERDGAAPLLSVADSALTRIIGPVISVADGIVVETKDSIPENTPRGAVARAVPIDLVTVAGNHVVVDMGQGHYAFYAHLQPGSLRVRVGDRVQRGQTLALLGNSGNSTEPHLHFHLVDAVASGTSTLGAQGIPYALDSFQVVGRCSLSGAGIACTRAAPVTVRGGIPLQNQLVRFPR